MIAGSEVPSKLRFRRRRMGSEKQLSSAGLRPGVPPGLVRPLPQLHHPHAHCGGALHQGRPPGSDLRTHNPCCTFWSYSCNGCRLSWHRAWNPRHLHDTWWQAKPATKSSLLALCAVESEGHLCPTHAPGACTLGCTLMISWPTMGCAGGPVLSDGRQDLISVHTQPSHANKVCALCRRAL